MRSIYSWRLTHNAYAKMPVVSARVVWGLSPIGKSPPVAKYILATVLFVLAGFGIGLPLAALATQPSVQAPTGPNSGGYFSGTYSFATYITCDSGVTLNGSYSNNLDGTHSFNFIGAPDGSLLVRIDGGGSQLITSCGAPFATPQTIVATYTVTKGTPPPPTPSPSPSPSPAPTPSATPPPPTPEPTPTPVPVPGGGGPSSGGGSPPGVGARAAPAPGDPPAPPQPSTAVATPDTDKTLTPSASLNRLANPAANPPPKPASRINSSPSVVGWLWLITLFAMVVLFVLIVRHKRAREYIQTKLKALIHGHDLPKRKGLSHKRHTGKVLAHHHTSYPALVFVMMLASVILTAYYGSSLANSSSDLSLTVTGAPPSVAPVITSPAGGETYTSSSLSVKGTCEAGLVVSLQRNGSAAGSVVCDSTGSFSLLLTLVSGSNSLVAYDLDGLNQSSPASNTVTVTYAPPPPPSPTPIPTPAPSLAPSPIPPSSSAPTSPVPQPTVKPGPTTPKPASGQIQPTFLITSDQIYYPASSVGQAVMVRLTLSGGHEPYEIKLDWGDGTKQTLNSTADRLNLSHSYAKPGSFQLVVRGSDTMGQRAVLSVAVIVAGSSAAPLTTNRREDGGVLAIAWPAMILTLLIIASFWLGEKHKRKQGFVPTPTPA